MRALSLLAFLLLAPLTAFAALININTADAALLETLPGIGPTKAQAIVEYRNQHGPFTRIEDIQNVSGIGPSTYAGIKDLITVGDVALPPPSASSTPTVSGGGGATPYVPPPSSLLLTVYGPHEAFLHVPIALHAQVLSPSGAIDTAASLDWSFGDGSTQTGTQVEKTYSYPGTYLIRVRATHGAVTTVDDLVVTTKEAQVRLGESPDGFTLTNETETYLDLSGWTLETTTGFFHFPTGTVLMPRATVLFPSSVTHLERITGGILRFPDRSVVPTVNDSQPPVQPSYVEARIDRVQAADRNPGAPENTTYVEPALAPTAAIALAAVGAPISPPAPTSTARSEGSSRPLWPWIAGLAAVIAVAGGVFILL
jgi:competence ComEA-like helix-hairpin-helix protein